MDAPSIFKIVNALALVSWIVLIIFPFSQLVIRFLFAFTVCSLALFYTIHVIPAMSPEMFEGFNSLEGVTALFSNPDMVLIGWVHYLCFDLMVGLYIVENARKHRINRWLILPTLLFTFMTGPFGLLLYVIIKAVSGRQILTYS